MNSLRLALAGPLHVSAGASLVHIERSGHSVLSFVHDTQTITLLLFWFEWISAVEENNEGLGEEGRQATSR
jgi:hypothetical protein